MPFFLTTATLLQMLSIREIQTTLFLFVLLHAKLLTTFIEIMSLLNSVPEVPVKEQLDTQHINFCANKIS